MIRACTVFVVMAALVGPSSAFALDFSVTRNDDAAAAGGTNDGICQSVGGGCTLRAAVTEANNTAGADRVLVGARTVTLTLGTIELKNLTELAGAGGRATIIRQTGANGLLTVAAGTVQIHDLTLREGAGLGGGALYMSGGTVTMDSVAVIDNHITFVGGAFGGGISMFAGSLAITRSLIAHNTATSTGGQAVGGGIGNNPGTTLTVIDSTIANNDAVPTGAQGFGGGIYTSGSLTLRRDTFFDNRAFGSGQGGNLNAGGSTIIEDTVLANGEDQLARNCVLGSVPLLQGRNLTTDHSCFAAGPNAVVDTDPLLGPLANNGGPSDTMAPLVGSPLVDRGAACTAQVTDQRGQLRPTGATCDIGAVEQGAQRHVSVSTGLTAIDPGEQATWVTRVQNDGLDASPSTVTLALPAGATLVLAQPSTGTCTGTGPVVCDVGNLTAGAQADIVLVATLATPGLATFAATVSGPVTDLNPADDTATSAVTVGALPIVVPPDPKACLTLIVGTSHANRLTGKALGDRLLGLDGNDTLDGAAGDDCLEGGPGNDSLKGSAGKDTLTGESGNDKLDGGTDNDKLDGGTGNDSLKGSSGDDKLTGSSGKDKFDGGSGKDTISGGSGNDTISARDKTKDTITCGSGHDTVTADKTDKVAHDCETVHRK